MLNLFETHDNVQKQTLQGNLKQKVYFYKSGSIVEYLTKEHNLCIAKPFPYRCNKEVTLD